MLGKLLKYDFRSMWKQFSVIWPAALVLALINRFTLDGTHGTSEVGEWTAVISLSVFIGVCFAMVIVSVVFVLTRFYKGLLGDEGYLMHTLPVNTWQLVLSKLICALAVTVVNGIVGILAMFLMMPLKWSEIFDFELWKMLFQGIWENPDSLLYLFEFFLMLLVVFSLMFTMLYLSMAIGHLFSRRRILMSVVAFFAIDIVGNLTISVIGNTGLDYWFSHIIAWSSHVSFWVGIGVLAIPAILMFLGTSWILKNKLNLE